MLEIVVLIFASVWQIVPLSPKALVQRLNNNLTTRSVVAKQASDMLELVRS